MGAARGQLLEEIASARVRLLSSQVGREVLGLGHITDELVFIEGSRIRDAAGAMLSNGVIGIRRGGELEIVAVLEAKAGHFAAGGLTESIAGLRRTSASEIIQAIIEASGSSGRGLVSERAMMKRLSTFLTPEHYQVVLKTMGADTGRERTGAAGPPRSTAVSHRPAPSRRSGRDTRCALAGEGQISRDLERLMQEGDGKLGLMVDGEAVTATCPTRPSFLGAAPSDVPLTGIAQQLGQHGYNFRPLDMGAEAMAKQELDELAAELVDSLGPDLINAGMSPSP